MSGSVAHLRPVEVEVVEVVHGIDYWADRIRGHLARTVEGIVAAGRDLQAAKDALPHGEWLPLLVEVGMNDRNARRLMSVAGHGELSKSAHCADLPAGDITTLANRANGPMLPAGDVATLAQLSRLPEPDLRAVIDAGEVRPDMKRADAVALVSPTPSRR